MTKNVEKVSVEKKSKFVDHLQFIQVTEEASQLSKDPIESGSYWYPIRIRNTGRKASSEIRKGLIV